MVLFCIVILLKYPGPNAAADDPTKTEDDVFAPLVMTVFLSVTLLTGVVFGEPINTAFGLVLEVLVIERSLLVPPTVLLPSIITLLPPLILISAFDADAPLIDVVTPDAGLIVIVLVVLEPVIFGIIIGNVSDEDA